MGELVRQRVEEGSLIDPILNRCEAICENCGFKAEDLRCIQELNPEHLVHFHNLGTATSRSGAKHVFATAATPWLKTLYETQSIIVPSKK